MTEVKVELVEMLDVHTIPVTSASTATRSTASTIVGSALKAAQVSNLLGEARKLRSDFKFTGEPIFLRSGQLDPKASQNEVLLEYAALMRAYNVTLAKISENEADMTLYYWRMAKRELEHFIGVYDRWIRTASGVFLGKIRGTTPAVTRPHGTVVDATIQPAGASERSGTEPVTMLAAPSSHKRKRAVAEAQPKREVVDVEEKVDADVKPVVKPDPDAPVHVNKGLSSKARILQAQRAVQGAELAVQQKKLELRMTDLALLEEEEAREAKHRRTGRRQAIDITLD